MSFAEYAYTEVLKPKFLKKLANTILLHITPIEDWDKLIKHLPGRRYTNIVGVKGYSLAFIHRDQSPSIFR
jgi:hypothetical protein